MWHDLSLVDVVRTRYLDLAQLLEVRFKCPSDAVAELTLWRTIPRRVRWIGHLLHRMDPDYFAPDRELVKLALRSTSLRELQVEVSNHQYHHPPYGFFRGLLRVRVSGQRLVSLGGEVFKTAQVLERETLQA